MGGTMVLLSNSSWGTADPAKNYTQFGFQLEQFVYDGLVGFQRASGRLGTAIVPDLAVAVPRPSDGGRTYVFQLRPGIRFSNGATVKASDFANVIRRQFTVPGPANSFYTGIVGGARCAASPAHCDLSKGVVTNDAARTVAFHLVAPDPEFLDKLALPFAAAVPSGTPAHSTGDTGPPGTGPYTMVSYNPNQGASLVRNRFFRVWSSAAQPQGYPDRIKVRIGLTAEQEVSEIENGQADWMADQPPADRLAEMSAKHGSQIHLNPQGAVYYMALNVNVPPFDKVDARRAINYAVNRAAYVKIFGGSALATPSCQVLPPNFPGYRPYCPYTLNPGSGKWTAPDVAKGRMLVAKSGTAGAAVSVYGTTDSVGKAITLQFVQDLDSVGFKATPKLLSNGIQYGFIQNSNNRVQVGYSQWFQDYPAASDFLNVLLGCANFHRGSDASPNISGFCDRTVQAKIAMAAKLEQGNHVNAANTVWAGVDRLDTDLGPIVSLFNPKVIDFVSQRVGHYEFNPIGYFLFDQAWVR